MNNLIVEKEEILFDFLTSNLDGKSKNNIKSLLKRGNVVVNDKVITKYDYPLKKGSQIKIMTTKLRNLKTNVDIKVLYEDKDIIVVNKPYNLLTIATEKEKDNTMYHLVSDYLKKTNKNNRVFVVHRLDKETSGILVFAKNEKTKTLFQDNWNDLVIKRGYVAVVEGIVPNETGEIKSWLKENDSLKVFSSNKPDDGLLAITLYKKIRSNDLYTLLDIEIKTGRKNQIRVHMKDINHPIIGDSKYGTGNNPIRRTALHAYILEFKNPVTNKVMTFKDKIPSEFERITR